MAPRVATWNMLLGLPGYGVFEGVTESGVNYAVIDSDGQGVHERHRWSL